jgi:hypothetical protein
MKQPGYRFLVLVTFFVILIGAPPTVGGQEDPYFTDMKYPSLHISGWADINYNDTDDPGSNSGFTQGQIVLHFSSALSKKTSVFSEISVTSPINGTASGSVTKAGVERLLIRFDKNDFFKIIVGRDHTPINWWNKNFHHGSWLQTTIERPGMVQFGGRFIPVHFLGTLVEGGYPAKGMNVQYRFGVGNGRGADRISQTNEYGESDNNRAWLVNLSTSPDRLFGLNVGASFYRDEIIEGSNAAREWIGEGYIVWEREDPEVIFEYANVNHSAPGNDSINSKAYYILLAYRLPWLEARLKPYYRYEHFSIPANEVFFVKNTFSQERSIGGIRYEASSYAAIKVEYRRDLYPGKSPINGFFSNVSFTF